MSPLDLLAGGLTQAAVAEGLYPVENRLDVPSGVTTVTVTHYGYWGDGPLYPAPGSMVEATKSEPDKNTYLVLTDQTGPDATYNYGTHFLFQGHESGPPAGPAGVTEAGYITRINLDAGVPHRVTVMAALDKDGNPLPTFDGSTYDPFADRLLFTSENGNKGGVWQATKTYPSVVEDISGALGRGGYEGIQNDADGNLIIIEDVGGKTGAVNTHARQPNSFVYRFVPKDKSDLTQGKLQALQVISQATMQPIVFHAGEADADIMSQDMADLHTYGKTLSTSWVTLHDTATDGSAPFDANALAKARGATPFKRPENAVFRPGSGFTELYFTETGDTDVSTEAGAARGGFGAIMKLSQASPSADAGEISMVYQGDAAHSGFDNLAFWSDNHLVVAEDAGDKMHTQRGALDSAYLFDLRLDYAKAENQPVRILAEGRDEAATRDAAFFNAPGFQNDGDNEITAIHISDGDATAGGILGAKVPRPFLEGWRVFWTRQHGENVTLEISRSEP